MPEEKTVPVERRPNHSHKGLSLFTFLVGGKPNPNPRINPVYSTVNDSSAFKQLKNSILKFLRSNYAIHNTIPKILEKYDDPNMPLLVSKFLPYSNFFSEYFKSSYDERYVRNLAEWSEILNYADESTVGAASKKYYGIDSNSKKSYISKRQIKQGLGRHKTVDIHEYFMHYLSYLSIFGRIISGRKEFLEEYKRMLEEYDKKRQIKQNKDYDYTYTGYKAIHYDDELYQKQKLEYQKGIRKSKPDGRIECRVREQDIPSDVLTRFLDMKNQQTN